MAGNRKNHSKIKWRRQRGTRNLFFRTQCYKTNIITSKATQEKNGTGTRV